ncbi:MAG TPA: endonuclease III [Nitrospirae bacterium]|nr:endonuclease III [Nitrospirota bacterium]HDO36082.1 endonuclease III [Nitrospirota bacterium]HDZ88918.1 endonuclease III [Nitrospirota bacterium]
MNSNRMIDEILKRLKREYPEQETALKHANPFELLVATILSAQTTDVHVNKVTEKLFRKYKNINDYACAPLEKFLEDIRSVNFYKNKGKNIRGAAGMIVERFNSRVPGTMEELITLPGVARKTANIVLSNAFGINEGIAVDTHVRRLSNRLGLTENQDPVKIEQDLMKITPKKEWSNLSHLLIYHGRSVCNAKKPRHDICVLHDLCPSNAI